MAPTCRFGERAPEGVVSSEHEGTVVYGHRPFIAFTVFRDNTLHMKPLVCVFAHPDDEAFGPGGTIAKFAKKREVYLICATKGEAGKYRGGKGKQNMAEIRANELRRSAAILGVRKVFFLKFIDGTLSNNQYHAIAKAVEKILRIIKPDTILTFEPRGVSGHIDHIAISLISSYLFERLPFIKTVMQYCVLDTPERRKRKYFVYLPPAYKKSEVNMVSDVRNEWDTKLRAMNEHQSQVHDLKRILKRYKVSPKEEYFLVERKNS
jgi:N-acetylglucosamine malate deacetylase 2